MPAAGTSLILPNGRRGVLASGRAAVFNSTEQCAPCCCPISFRFWDEGFINGGQNGAPRYEYAHPNDVTESPWSVIVGAGQGICSFTVRLWLEDDNNCHFHNPYIQIADVEAIITLPPGDWDMKVSIAGWAESEDPGGSDPERFYDYATFWYWNGSGTPNYTQFAESRSTGGGLGCPGGMIPVTLVPPGPAYTIPMALGVGGPVGFFMHADTVDDLFHDQGSLNSGARHSVSVHFEPA